MKRLFPAIVLFTAAAMMARAHFVFVVPDAGGSSARVFLSETLEPDPQIGPEYVANAKLTSRDANGRETTLTLSPSGKIFTTVVPGSGARVIHGITDLGVSGEAGKQYLLLYHPKTIVGNAFDAKTILGNNVPVELIPEGKPGAMKLKLVSGGKPLADAEITVLLPDGHEKPVKTNSAGETATFTAPGRYGAWARFWETSASGERNGKKYAETHHYATLVFDVDQDTVGTAQPAGAAETTGTTQLFATLPQPTASFGAVVSNGWLYVYGGHVAPTHNYFVGAVSGRFDRLRLTGDPVWEELPGGPPAQGLNLAEHDGKIYRVGGMQPQNKQGDPSDDRSIADAARFDPATRRWEDLPPLPTPRSSHDVAVIGDQLFVVGGWNMKGRGKGEDWADQMLVLDLAAKNPQWNAVPQPFERRALMAAAFNGKLYVVGGMNSKEAVETTVNIYDPKTKQWSQGTKLPNGAFGFSPAVGVHAGSLFVSVSDGTLYRLNEAGAEWQKAGKSTPRVAHRLASRGDSVLVIGGADNGKNSDLIEAVQVP